MQEIKDMYPYQVMDCILKRLDGFKDDAFMVIHIRSRLKAIFSYYIVLLKQPKCE